MHTASHGDFVSLKIEEEEISSSHCLQHDAQNEKSGDKNFTFNKPSCNITSQEANLKFQRHILPWGQKYSWDCGIACIAQCLPIQNRRKLYDDLQYYRDEFGLETSIWTIDLCYILHRLKKSFVFVTNFLGVNPEFKDYRFYRKIMDKDTERVYKRFSEASDLGILITVKTISLEEILENVLVRGPAIVLVNGNLLDCIDCPMSMVSVLYLTCCFRRCFHGHYVLVTGFDLKENYIYYNNPSFSERTCRMHLKDFDKARRSTGTDCDAILIKNDEQCETPWAN